MEAFQFEKIPTIPFPKGTYIVVHHGVIPGNGFVLSDVKLIHGWPNPILEASRKESPVAWIKFVDNLSLKGNERPQFNMGLYQVKGRNYPAAVYGPLEGSQALNAVLFCNHLNSLPDSYHHLAHIF